MIKTVTENIPSEMTATMGEVDHREVVAPYLRLVTARDGCGGDTVYVYDFRVSQPNLEIISSGIMHSLEHIIHVALERALPGFINCAPMGCQTGFYITTLNQVSYEAVESALAGALAEVVVSRAVPLCNVRQCGNAANHDLEGAQVFARTLLDRRQTWHSVFS